MVNELYEVEQVKIEFLQSIAEEYSTMFTDKQLDMCVYMLNDFVNACTSNNLALIRIPEQIAVQQPQQYQHQGYQIPVADPFQNQEMPPVRPPQPAPVYQQVNQMNNQMQQQQQDVDLSTNDKPKTFQDKIREMRGAPKKQPGNKVNPNED